MNQNNLEQRRHSCAHLLAAAVKQLYPGAHNAIGPSIEQGFYQDFDMGEYKISEEDFPKIEERMRALLKEWGPFQTQEVSIEEAKQHFADNPYKLELIDEFAGQGKTITENNPGNFLDLCKGGHSDNPQEDMKYFKLLSVAGAYWRGDEKNKMLTRIYGTCFPTQSELDQHLQMMEEAKLRDHRKLGRELDLFVFSDLVGKGLPLFTPKGTILRELLNDYSQQLRLAEGFQKVWIPHITKKELYETSGHWAKFGDELFLVKSQETSDELVMKPMNCPHHQQIYASHPRSYRDLPIKYLETTTVYRDEKAGELGGLSRVRSITQDDSHTFCTIDQIDDIYSMLIRIVAEFYGKLGMTFKARLSFRDPNNLEKYHGNDEDWIKAQSILEKVVKEHQLEYYIAEGEAAFYGPKIDFMVKDAIGREHQLATPQLDFVQPKRFGLTYVDRDGSEQTPVMIHFALLGSIERFLSVYIEHTAGNFPVWLAPVQIQLAPVSDKHTEGAFGLAKELEQLGIRVAVDDASETIGNKVRKAAAQKIPYVIVYGDKEMSGEDWMIRVRGEKDQIKLSKADFVERVLSEIKERKS